MGQQTSIEHAPLTFGYVNHSSENIERVDTPTLEDAEDFILKNPHLYKLQAICDQCSNTNNIVLSSVINEACNQCKRQKRLSLVRSDLAEDLEYIDQTYYPGLVHYNTTEQDPMEKELLEFQDQQQQWSKLTIGDAVTPGINMRRPRRLTGPSMDVDLSNKSLVKLSPSIGYLQNLTKLNLSNNQMMSLPKEIGYLKNLRVLNINNNMIEEIPDTVAFLSKLKAFDVSHNSLVKLPEAIGQLSKLVILIANQNQLTSLPRGFAKLSNLISLNVSNNPLACLPAEIAKLATLRKLLTENCPFEDEYNYNLSHDPPSLFETCARIVVRSKMKVPSSLAEHVKDYLSRPDTCSYCKSPFFESYVTRVRFIERRGRQVLALEDRMCCAHWSTNEDRILDLFSEQKLRNADQHVYHKIDMNGLHDTLANRHRAYSDTSNNYNSVNTSSSLVRSNTNYSFTEASTSQTFLKPLPSLPTLTQEGQPFPNRPRSLSAASMTKRFNKFIGSSSSSPSTPRQRSGSACSRSSPLHENTLQLELTS